MYTVHSPPRSGLRHARRLFVLLIVVILPLQALASESEPEEPFDPPGLYLTWHDDPTKSIVINWLVDWTEGYRDPAIQYRHENSSEWRTAIGTWRPVPFSSDRLIHTVELSELSPGRSYEFRFGKLESKEDDPFSVDDGGFVFHPDSETYRFRTMPANAEEPITFVAGGDLYQPRHEERYVTMSRHAAEHEPYFAMIGGDLAYCDGNPERLYRWNDFFRIWKEEMVTPSGYHIPIIVSTGNHEVHGDEYDQRGSSSRGGRGHPNRTPFVKHFFPFLFPDGYGVIDVADYMSIFLIDTHHMVRVDGKQKDWLRSRLSERQGVSHLFPIYHVTGYTSARDFDRPLETRIRENWYPLFDEYGVRVAFENHDHTYKRTPPIRGGDIDSTGTIYLGDGAWGIGPRSVHDPDETWYLERAEGINNVLVVTIQGQNRYFQAINLDGEVFDEFEWHR